MTTTTRTPPPVRPDREALLLQGFTPQQIDALERIQADGITREFVTPAQLARLRFIRWWRDQTELREQ